MQQFITMAPIEISDEREEAGTTSNDAIFEFTHEWCMFILP